MNQYTLLVFPIAYCLLQEQVQLGRSESAAELQQGWQRASTLQQQISELEAQLVVQQGGTAVDNNKKVTKQRNVQL